MAGREIVSKTSVSSNQLPRLIEWDFTTLNSCEGFGYYISEIYAEHTLQDIRQLKTLSNKKSRLLSSRQILMIRWELVSEISVIFHQLTWLIARKDFIRSGGDSDPNWIISAKESAPLLKLVVLHSCIVDVWIYKNWRRRTLIIFSLLSLFHYFTILKLHAVF
jgi:hypothetical protein